LELMEGEYLQRGAPCRGSSASSLGLVRLSEMCKSVCACADDTRQMQ